jgi:hypothetical protein
MGDRSGSHRFKVIRGISKKFKENKKSKKIKNQRKEKKLKIKITFF